MLSRAGWLNTAEGRRFADEYTTASVVVGVSLVLVCLRFVLPAGQLRKVALAFALAGAPMIGRSLANRPADRR